MITAYPSKETQEKARGLGLLDYLAKSWLELGAVFFRLCTHAYERGSCVFAQEIQDKFRTIAVIGEDEVTKFRRLPGSPRLCRYTALHFARKHS